MFIKDGMAHADNQEVELEVKRIEYIAENKFKVVFSTNEEKIFDISPLLNSQAFSILKENDNLSKVSLEYGVPSWLDGQIDLSPDYIYSHSEKSTNKKYA